MRAGWANHAGRAKGPKVILNSERHPLETGVGQVRRYKLRAQQVQVHRGTKQPGLLEQRPGVQSMLRKLERWGMDRESGTDHKEL